MERIAIVFGAIHGTKAPDASHRPLGASAACGFAGMKRGIMKNTHVGSILYALVLQTASIAQIETSAPAFEVASIKPNAAGGNMIEVTPGRLAITSATLATCIKW